ncbi:DUF805 domain-containing protein [Roseibium denhamense]|uniref:Uncharacterized membrane protein YhaH, DUF805 family n=1 Tax=Roseibium denhamense TaxID=76305 RepID=A0ABY1P0W8_9HYPH|nr:DUF805 domain-containing protein [Roseibium denhamense]MTI04928.1 DUF805 domain-containing protein [Roseibium denhamense]SMP23334.1 Uncharacterized membrane protein YhaH, DUF805 family [Roseibium denhamense]
MTAPLPDANIAPNLSWALLSPKGRLGREAYLLCLGFWVSVGVILNRAWAMAGLEQAGDPEAMAFFFMANPVTLFAALALVWIEFAIVVKRLHDIGRSGFFALLLLVPVLNLAIMGYLAFQAPEPAPNRHGPLPDSYWQ